MHYEWDERKRASNLEKHGLDFVDARHAHEALHKVTVEVTRAKDRERRFADFAEVGGGVLRFVYTRRDGMVRCISLRSDSRLERKMFNEIRNR